MKQMSYKQEVIGILAIFFAFSTLININNTNNNFFNTHNPQSIKATEVAFGVYRADEINSANRSLPRKQTLKKYENVHTLTDTELKELLQSVGFEGEPLRTAWAIVKRESNGRPLAFNGNVKTGDNSYGLFQINMIGQLGPDRREKFGLKSNAELFNPVKNAQIAYYMSNKGTNWIAWKGMTPKTKFWMSKFPNNKITDID
jgi:hypothetical protein